MTAAGILTVILLLIAAALTVFLIVALLFPDKF